MFAEFSCKIIVKELCVISRRGNQIALIGTMVHIIGISMRTRLYEDAILEAICFSLIIMISAGTGVEFHSKVSNR